MHPCCPPGEGCNSPSSTESCALTRLRRSSSPDALRALGLWERYSGAGRSLGRQRRVLRRAYMRVRDQALPRWSPFRPVS